MLGEADVRYITANFRPLEAICHGRSMSPEQVREAISAAKLPRATYVLEGGTEMFPPDYLELVYAAGGVDQLPFHFEARYVAEAELQGGLVSGEETAEEWATYLSGEYGACLREVTPENIVRKDRLVRAIERLLDEPAPENPDWRDELQRSVDELDTLEREFAPYDRVRWGKVSRDRLITAVRERYPEAFAAAPVS